MSIELTARQKDVLVLFAELDREGEWPPTLREIGNAVGISSTSGLRKFEINPLVDLGLLTRGEFDRPRQNHITNHGRSTARRILRDDPWPLAPEAFDTAHGTAMLPVYEWQVGDAVAEVPPAPATMPRVEPAAPVPVA